MMVSFKIILCIFISIIVSSVSLKNRKNMSKSVDTEYPKKSDLEQYMLSLEKLFAFYTKHPNDIDVNVVFGFFLSNVNLNSALRNKTLTATSTDLPISRLLNLTNMNKKLVGYFRMMARRSQSPSRNNKQLKKIATLFSNESLWVSAMKQIDKKELQEPPQVSYDDIIFRFSSWPKYKQEVDNVQRVLPSFELTEKCLVVLAENEVYSGNGKWPKCVLSQDCYNGLNLGNDIGYGLANRLMLLLQARYGRRCSIFEKEQDVELAKKLCLNSYHESAFISMNKYDPLTVFINHLVLCYLNGNSEFVRRPWLSFILALQTPHGCFSETVLTRQQRKQLREIKPSMHWQLYKEQNKGPGDICSGVLSSGAGAIISAAIKYIIDMYY